MKKLFGTDGIRGPANIYPLTVEMCCRLSEVLAKKFCKTRADCNLVVIGKDTRLSCDVLECALTASLCSLGVTVKLLGVCPTPAVSIVTKGCDADFGIMISASHNTFSDNGIKIFDGSGSKLSDVDEAEIESMINDETVVCERVVGKDIGLAQYDFCDFKMPFLQRYIDNIQSNFVSNIKSTFYYHKKEAKRWTVVIDCANGSLSRIAPNVFHKIGFDIWSAHKYPNGVNINDGCGATNLQEISALVLAHNADLGVAFDGDGDRLILSDETGRILDGDYILAALADLYQLENTEIVSTIMANYGLEEHLKTKNIQLIRTDVGDRYVADRMRQSNAIIGGEPSGHIIIKEHALTGDALFAALKILEYLMVHKKKGSDIFDLFEKYPVVRENVKVADKSVVSHTDVRKVIEKFEKELSNRGKLIVRPSGTEPLIRVSAEGRDENELRDIVNEICEAIANYGGY